MGKVIISAFNSGQTSDNEENNHVHMSFIMGTRLHGRVRSRQDQYGGQGPLTVLFNLIWTSDGVGYVQYKITTNEFSINEQM